MDMDQHEAVQMFHRLHHYVMNYDADGQAELFSENGVWEFPFATSPLPKKIEGRESIRLFGNAGMRRSQQEGRRIVDYTIHSIHPSGDNSVIVEFDLNGEVMPAGTRYSIPYIQVLQVKEGFTTSLRDYFPMEVLRAILVGSSNH